MDAIDEQKEAEDVLSELEFKLRSGCFREVDDLLDLWRPDAMGVPAVLCALTITWHGKDKLTRRQFFLSQAEESLERRLGKERAEHLLKNRR